MLLHSRSLHWIARHFKAFSCPIVMIAEEPLSVSAYYDWDINQVVELDGNEIYNENGIIVIASDCQVTEETVILHEYRHHLQVALNGKWPVPNWSEGESTEDYNQCCYERDARLFERSIGFLDDFTEAHRTPKLDRTTMLSLPTPEFLARI